LVDDLKYDLRIYVLVNSVNPLRVYIHEEGLARFCTEPYKKPTARNINNHFMHLTNYAINKFSSAYEAGAESEDEDSGHKRSLKAIMNILEKLGADKAKLMEEIKDIVVKTMATG
jgi:tubulin polyglutamylase TTLL6/13